VKSKKKTKALLNAVRCEGNFDEIEAFVGGDCEFRGGKYVVAGPQGPIIAAEGDFIVKRDDGSFYAYTFTI
jgi:hypothetical protein